jgi:hypothetical protein
MATKAEATPKPKPIEVRMQKYVTKADRKEEK